MRLKADHSGSAECSVTMTITMGNADLIDFQIE